MKRINKITTYAILGVAVALGSFGLGDKVVVPSMLSGEFARVSDFDGSRKRFIGEDLNLLNAVRLDYSSRRYLCLMYLQSCRCSDFERKVLWLDNRLAYTSPLIRGFKRLDADPVLVNAFVNLINERSQLSRDIVKYGPFDESVRKKMVEEGWGTKLENLVRSYMEN